MAQSYKDPLYAGLASSVEGKLGLPPGLLLDIVTKGEKTNADQVSEAGAKTVFQVIPSTRDLVLKRYGVDAYLSPENAALAAGYVLRDGINFAKRKTDDPDQVRRLAAGYYHAGGDEANWGKRTEAYMNRVQPQPSTYERVKAEKAASTGTSLGAQYQAYKSGAMSQEQKAAFEKDVSEGNIVLPSAMKVGQAVAGTAAPKGALDAYIKGRMPDADKAEFEGLIKDGTFTLPQGLTLDSLTKRGDIPTGGATAPAYTGKDPELARLQAGGAAPTTAQKVRGAAELLNMPFALAGGVVGGVAGAGEALLTGKPVMDTAALRAGQGAVGMMPIPPTQAGQELMGNIAGSDAVAQLQALGPAGLVSSLGTRAVGAGMSTARQMAPVVAQQSLPKVAQAVESIQAGRAVKQAAAAQAATGAQQTVSAAERLGVPVMTTDVKQPTTFIGRAVQTLGERIPGAGTGGARAEQQTARIDAVRNVLKDYGADDAAALSDDVMRDLSTKRGADLKKYSEMKNGVIDAADATGPAPMPRATAAIDAEIAKLSSLNTAEVTPVVAKLEDFRNAIQGQGLRNIDELRKQLGESFKSPELAGVRSASEKATGKIYGALKEDMREAIAATGGKRDVLKWEVANKRLSEMAGELGSNALKAALNKGATEPEQVRKLLFSTKPSEVRLLYKNLTPDGRASARAAILQEAAKKAGGDAALSPTRFANEVGRLGESVGVFFTKDDRAAIDGLTRVLNATKRAGEFAANPPSGVQLYPAVGAAALTDIFGGFGAGIVSGLSLGGVARLYESKAVRNMLISMPKTKPGSREEISLVNRILSGMRGVQQQRATQ